LIFLSVYAVHDFTPLLAIKLKSGTEEKVGHLYSNCVCIYNSAWIVYIKTNKLCFILGCQTWQL